jgi:hypothetical protein
MDMDMDDCDDAFISHENYTRKNDLDSNYLESSDDESKNRCDSEKSANQRTPKFSNEQLNANSLSITTKLQSEPTINHAEKKTNHDESLACPDKKDELSARDKRLVEDYNYFFASEENSFEDDDEAFVGVDDGEELADVDDVDYDDEEFEDDEKENEPPAKFVKIAATTPDKCNIHNL